MSKNRTENPNIASGRIDSLEKDEIFVFGSNLEGKHLGGAAKAAHNRFGAQWGVGVGFFCLLFVCFGLWGDCFMLDVVVAVLEINYWSTRATACMDKAAEMDEKLIFAIGKAPTALVRLYELIEEGKISPELIIGVPVGFVNVVQSKELIMHADVPYIVAKGRKGGSNIAACIVNALLYMIDNRRD